ncbi:MAG: RNA polymerase sigma factor [Deltaproteobacteria bacterium]|jgi:RNA polymerase sigma-70 factor (ECF subfamily)|nr:RNA polymerase sigma factor [Deltaproteobacteria bacterium]
MVVTSFNGTAASDTAANSRREAPPSDEEVVRRLRAGEARLFEVILRRYNQRLYRVARAIVADDDEAQDALQSAYLRAYTHLAQFDGRSSFATWLTRIAINEARARARLRGGQRPLDASQAGMGTAPEIAETAPAAEDQALLGEIRQLLERAISQLPEPFRLVFILRDVEQLSGAEAAALLDIREPTVKTRLHRARGLLRKQLSERLGAFVPHAFEFAGARCDGLVAAVMGEIARRKA